MMNNYIEQRVLNVADYFLDTNCTVRNAAKKFGYSKSTIHLDVTKRLSMLDTNKAREIEKILAYNESIRHIRGGASTKKKYSK